MTSQFIPVSLIILLSLLIGCSCERHITGYSSDVVRRHRTHRRVHDRDIAETTVIATNSEINGMNDTSQEYSDDGSTHPDDSDTTNVLENNCTRCWLMEEAKRVRIETIKYDILRKLQLSAPPNVTGKRIPNIPSIRNIIHNFEMNRKSPVRARRGSELQYDDDDEYATTNTVMAFAQNSLPTSNTRSFADRCYFDIRSQVKNHKVHEALLWIYVRKPHYELDTDLITVKVYKNIPLRDNSRMYGKTGLRTSTITVAKLGNWIQIEIKGIVQRWLRRPETNLGLYIEARDPYGANLVMVQPDEGESDYRPMLEVRIMDNQSTRHRRIPSGLDCSADSKEERCCRFPMTVDFVKFDWDWIIAPKTYHANYCFGDCPFAFMQDYPHSHLFQQVKPKGRLGPCCTARKLSPIPLLYFDDNGNVVLGVLPGMVVDRCGC